MNRYYQKYIFYKKIGNEYKMNKYLTKIYHNGGNIDIISEDSVKSFFMDILVQTGEDKAKIMRAITDKSYSLINEADLEKFKLLLNNWMNFYDYLISLPKKLYKMANKTKNNFVYIIKVKNDKNDLLCNGYKDFYAQFGDHVETKYDIQNNKKYQDKNVFGILFNSQYKEVNIQTGDNLESKYMFKETDPVTNEITLYLKIKDNVVIGWSLTNTDPNYVFYEVKAQKIYPKDDSRYLISLNKSDSRSTELYNPKWFSTMTYIHNLNTGWIITKSDPMDSYFCVASIINSL
jgi:hypothetical protein